VSKLSMCSALAASQSVIALSRRQIHRKIMGSKNYV
jgi:hypothetical protein